MNFEVISIPELPTGIKNGVAGAVGRKLFCGLGSAGKKLFTLDLDNIQAGWQSVAPFPGVARNDSVSIVSGEKLYVFSGAGIEAANDFPTVLMDGYFYDTVSDSWHQIDTLLPIGLLGASGCEIAPNKLVFFGGYNKEIFDNLLGSLAKSTDEATKQAQLIDFMSQPVEDYRWNSDIWCFDTQSLVWSRLGNNPYAANCGAGIVVQEDRVTLVEGEIKPGLRSLETKQYCFDSALNYQARALPPISSSFPKHEGLAGAYVELHQGRLLAAGGAFFIGSQSNYQNGVLYTHQGLTKHYSDKVFALEGEAWKLIGQLPEGRAYGMVMTTQDCVYFVGGEDQWGDPQANCWQLHC